MWNQASLSGVLQNYIYLSLFGDYRRQVFVNNFRSIGCVIPYYLCQLQLCREENKMY